MKWEPIDLNKKEGIEEPVELACAIIGLLSVVLLIAFGALYQHYHPVQQVNPVEESHHGP